MTASAARSATGVDVDAYLRRIGHSGPLRADAATLEALHVAHAGSIPFENLHIQLGGVPSLDLADLQAKMVHEGRGGYCFEQNTLFMAVLREIGFDVRPREGRVMLTISARRPRTHMALEVDIGNDCYHADVGFGANGPLLPIPLDGREHQQYDRAFRFELRDDVNVLQCRPGRRWIDLVGLEPGYPQPVDFEVANWYTATHPRSVFRTNLMADLQRPNERYRLQNTRFTTIIDGHSADRDIERDEISALLRDVYGLEVPEDASFVAFAEAAE